MCGICGLISFAEEPVERGALEGACGMMRHRGPDQAGAWIDSAQGGAVGFGAVRLCVQDPSDAASQPMHRASGRFHLVFNGEVYNFREIRRTLAAMGEVFVTEGDTEVVLAACARWGVESLDRFDGMWGLAFFDALRGEGFCARDRFGIKPLVYAADAKGLAFASELRALGQLGAWDRTVDPIALAQHLQFGYIAHPETIYAGARRLAPGHVLRFTRSKVYEPKAWYRLPVEPIEGAPADNGVPDENVRGDVAARIRRGLSDAVTARRVSDVPIGAFLSGGLDSSIIVYHLAEAMSEPVKTFCVGYAGRGAGATYDETPFARLVAARLGTEHHEMILSERDVLAAIPRVLDHLGEPVGDSSIIPTMLISAFARQHVTVALSGDGGDELFGGYWRYLGHAAAAYARVPAILRRALFEPWLAAGATSRSSVVSNRRRQLRKLLRADDDDPMRRHLAWSRILSPEAAALFTDPRAVADCDARTHALAHRLTGSVHVADPLARILAFDLQYPLPADMLHKVDLAGMMHSLEVRVPFLDPAVVEPAVLLPSSLKIDRGLRKRILVDAYRGRLPDAVLDRPKKGFEVPIGEFLRTDLRELFCDTVTRPIIESFDLLSYDAVDRLYREHRQRRADHADVLFALLSLCWWRRRTT